MPGMYKIQELLTRGLGTEGSLLIARTLSKQLVDDVEASLIDRRWAAMVVGPAEVSGKSYDLNLVDLNSMSVEVVAEGALIPIGNPTYSVTNIVPKKVAIRPTITREMIEDGQYNLIDHAVRYASRKIAEYENTRVVAALDGANETVAGGTSVTIANITAAMLNVEENGFKPRVYFVGVEVLSDLRSLGAFSDASMYGSAEMHQRGVVGKIYGMDVVVVSSDGDTGYTATTSYVVDPEFAYIIVEKRPVTIEMFDDPQHDMEGVVISQRIEAAVVRSRAIGRITSS